LQPFEHQQLPALEVVLHPDFRQREVSWQAQWEGVGEVNWDGSGYVQDLAILFVKEEFQLTEHISPICLPLDPSDYDSDKCFVSGFGKNESGIYQTTLQDTEVSLLERSDCEEHLKKSSGSSSIFGVRLQESSICSSGGDDGGCEGDDGGALVCASSDDPATFVQAGVVSWRAGQTSCGDQQRLQDGQESSTQAAGQLGQESSKPDGQFASGGSPGVRVHNSVAAHSCWIRGVLDCGSTSRSCHHRVLRSCAECEKNFNKNTSLRGHRVRARRTETRSLAACWQRCRERPDCRFVNWVKEHRRSSKRRQCTLLRSRGRARPEQGVVSGSGC